MDGDLILTILAAAAPVLTAVLGSLYISWRVKVINDGITDWKDNVVSFLDGLAEEITEDEDKPAQ